MTAAPEIVEAVARAICSPTGLFTCEARCSECIRRSRAAIAAHEAALAAAGQVIAPRAPTDEMRIRAVQGMRKGMDGFIEKLKAENRDSEWIVLEVSCSSYVTDEVWRAMIEALGE